MKIITKLIKKKSGNLKIWGIQTGKLAIKKSALSSNNPGLLSTVWSFRDKDFGEWLPIWVWLIEHPEGVFLIDTGLSNEVIENNYFEKLDFVSKYYFKKQMKFDISEKEEIHNRLKNIGIPLGFIDKIILTHLHIDHTGGLKHFPDIPVLVNKREWETKDGSFPKLFPKNLNFKKVRLESKFENFERAHYLTKNKDLILVETQGHTRGHCSVILKIDEDHLIFFAGDVAYNENRLKSKTFSATIKNHKTNIASCNQILNLAMKKSIIFLPSHDLENGERLLKELEIATKN